MSVADASVFVAYYYPQDIFHATSRAWLQQHLGAGERIVAPLLILGEVAGALARQTGDPQIAHAAVQQIHALPGLDLVPLNEELADLAAQLAADLRLRGADACYVAVAVAQRLSLVTWDREQLERGSGVITTRRPDDL